MSKYEVDTVRYILVRKKLNNRNQEDVVIYSEYNGAFNFNQDVARATRFEDKDKAEQLAYAQNVVSQVMDNGYEYNVIEESTVRKMTTEETETTEEENSSEEEPTN